VLGWPSTEVSGRGGGLAGQAAFAVVVGFLMLFEPLKPGQHIIRVHGTNTIGHDKTFTYFLTID
jgi:hypothetical protein